MAVTSILSPNSNSAIGTGLGDGTNYGAFGNPERVHATSTGNGNALAFGNNKGTLWFNCFNNSQIPSGSSIDGVEFVGGADPDGVGNGYLARSTVDANAVFTFKVFLWNGSSYSSALPILLGNSGTNWTLSNNNTELSSAGAGFNAYPNTTTPGAVYAGGTSNLSGLSWNASNQADFGFALTITSRSGNVFPFAARGLGLRITYTEGAAGYSNKVAGIDSGDIAKVSGIAAGSISKVIGV